ncbi:MAG: hypothetical protein JWQ49_3120 [Edaphobacter sp.]|nr:hypothetical protein [Edaphobacter sp.]
MITPVLPLALPLRALSRLTWVYPPSCQRRGAGYEVRRLKLARGLGSPSTLAHAESRITASFARDRGRVDQNILREKRFKALRFQRKTRRGSGVQNETDSGYATANGNRRSQVALRTKQAQRSIGHKSGRREWNRSVS